MTQPPGMRLLGAADIEAALPMRSAIQVMRRACIDISAGRGAAAERQALPLADGTALFMGAVHDQAGIAAKQVSVIPANAARGLSTTIGMLLLSDPVTGQPLALLDGTALTAWRTAAVSACAIDALARTDARTALMIGCGTQAATQLVGLVTARRLETIQVHARNAEKVEQFVGHYGPRLSARLAAVKSLDHAVASADIIVTVTDSETPVFEIEQLVPGCHVNGIGSFRPGMCEIDPDLARRARVFVESRATAAREGGELATALIEGTTRAEDWTELGEVFAGRAQGRADSDTITWFKSVGHALFDLHFARAVYDNATELRLGTEWAP